MAQPPPTGQAETSRPGAPVPPRMVRYASAVLYVMAALQLAMAASAIHIVLTVDDADREAVTAFSDAAVAIVAELGVAAAIAALMVLAGIFVTRGRSWARILAIVTVVLQFCTGLAAAEREFGGAVLGEAGAAAYAAWQAQHSAATIVGQVLSVLLVLAPIVLIVLLVTGSARAYFQHRQAVKEWTPPTFRAS